MPHTKIILLSTVLVSLICFHFSSESASEASREPWKDTSCPEEDGIYTCYVAKAIYRAKARLPLVVLESCTFPLPGREGDYEPDAFYYMNEESRTLIMSSRSSKLGRVMDPLTAASKENALGRPYCLGKTYFAR